jgi:glucokinase
MTEVVLAVDIGGSKYMAGLVDREGAVIARRCFAWESQDRAGVLPQVIAGARGLLEQFEEPAQLRLTGVGATIPGLADARSGTWLEASFSGIRDLPVADALHEAFGVPAYADNDAQACALAEKLFGGGRGVRDFLYATISNGIGGAAFSGDRLLQGATGCACELGHCQVVPDGRPCGCGNRGCLEAYAAGPGLAQTYRACSGQQADGREIARRARAGEAAAQEAFRREGEYLGRGLSWAVNLLNPAKVVLGGGLSLAFDLFGPALLETLGRAVYRTANPSVAVEPTRLGYEGALLGAAAVCICRQENRYYDFGD